MNALSESLLSQIKQIRGGWIWAGRGDDVNRWSVRVIALCHLCQQDGASVRLVLRKNNDVLDVLSADVFPSTDQSHSATRCKTNNQPSSSFFTVYYVSALMWATDCFDVHHMDVSAQMGFSIWTLFTIKSSCRLASFSPLWVLLLTADSNGLSLAFNDCFCCFNNAPCYDYQSASIIWGICLNIMQSWLE